MAEDPRERMLRHVQFLALGNIVLKLLAAEFQRSGKPAEKADEWLALADAVNARMTFPEVEPVRSDAAAQELRDFEAAMIRRARALATGERYDPGAGRPRRSTKKRP